MPSLKPAMMAWLSPPTEFNYRELHQNPLSGRTRFGGQRLALRAVAAFCFLFEQSGVLR